ncbi:MAG: hypothetical protein ISR58_14245 [Anaerolineales bacterium]|nr:hypothetical protein [Chloroflexota bacterium]MBL6982336.1 hypothetical protein [Anaerolineales bacterium]
MSHNRSGFTLFRAIIVGFALVVTACQPTDHVLSGEISVAETTKENLPTPTIEQQDNADLNAREILTYDELMSGFDYTSPLDESALTIPIDAAPPEHIFEGRLELVGEDTIGDLKVLLGDPNQEPEVSHLPEFDFEFVQQDGYLIPVQRGLIITDHPQWNYFIEPGRVWQEAGDQGYSRASFPFALNWKGANAVFNGTMTFLFDDEHISKVWYQISQEIAIGFSGDLWGLLDANYHSNQVAGSDGIKAAFLQEVANRFPTKPLEDLAEKYPEVDLTAFGRGIRPRYMNWYGLIIEGVNYVGGCQTRYGTYPYCEYMRVPSYSTAKSAFASIALMRLAQKYDPEVKDFLIADYVPEAVESPGDWSAVTFDNTLDMATGNFRTSRFMVDEEQWDNPFWNEEYYAERIAAAFNWPHGAPPGTQWVYRSSDTFIVTRAMANYLKTQEGSDADIFEFVVQEIYQPLNLGPGVFSTQRTQDDNYNGHPIGLGGMWWVPDDLAKITTFLNVDGGVIDGEQILHPDILAAALQRDPNDRGVVSYPGGQYNNAFWADRYTENEGYSCEFWVAEMQGYSGVVVVLMPNGTIYYYASDNQDFTWDAAVRESDKLIPHCSD